MKTLYYKKGDEIIKEGAVSDCAYVIEVGQAEVYKEKPDGDRQVIEVLQKNDIFGEVGLIDGLPRSASVSALEDCSVSVMTREAFNSLARHNAQALMPVLKVLAKRLRSALQLIEGLQDGENPMSPSHR